MRSTDYLFFKGFLEKFSVNEFCEFSINLPHALSDDFCQQIHKHHEFRVFIVWKISSIYWSVLNKFTHLHEFSLSPHLWWYSQIPRISICHWSQSKFIRRHVPDRRNSSSCDHENDTMHGSCVLIVTFHMKWICTPQKLILLSGHILKRIIRIARINLLHYKRSMLSDYADRKLFDRILSLRGWDEYAWWSTLDSGWLDIWLLS